MLSHPREASDAAVAVIDVGSNSGRVVAYLRDAAGHLRMLAGSRAPLRLAGELDADRRLTPEAEERALDALRDFRAIALGAGARRILAVATSALRDAANGSQFLERVQRELGFELKLIDGAAEARYGFLGGVRGLPVWHGMLFDQGGGSLQVVHFRDRRPQRSWSLPLGALRLSRAFLGSDPPRGREVRALLAHVRKVVAAADLPRLAEDEELVGTGGTVRNLARIDRRMRPYPIDRVHGYLLKGRRLHGLAAVLSGRALGKRARIRGLSDERADSIAGGALALTVLIEALGASRILLSGMGVREGIAYSLESDELPEPEQVRLASVASLASRFWGVEVASANRRAALAEALLRQLDPAAQPEMAEAVRDAAQLLDIGRAVDFFDRHRHTADIILETEMNGFSHRQIALTSAIVRVAGDERSEPERYAPLLDTTDWAAVERAAVLLTLADDIEERCPPGGPLAFDCRVEPREVALAVPALGGWRPRGVGARFERAFGRALRVRPGVA